MAARDPRGLREAIDRRLLDLIDAAVRHLPPGWSVETVPPGGRRGVESSPLSIAVQLIDPGGRHIPALTRDKRGAVYTHYRRLADLVFCAQRLWAPELEGQLAWGGNFTLSTGEWDVTHFDLAGWRGRGGYRRPPREAAPPAMLAEYSRRAGDR